MKLSLLGVGGQGIKLLGKVLAKILTDNNHYIALTFEYDAFVRKGKSNSYLVFSKERIENPIIDGSDLLYDLKDKKLQNRLLKKYNNPKVMNMILLGEILKKLKLKIPKDMKKYLPKKFLKENLQAISQGYK